MYQHINSLKQLRAHLGLSQTALADYLGIARTILIRAETGLCTLTTPILKKLGQLEIWMQDISDNINVPDIPIIKTYSIKHFNRRMRIEKLEKELGIMEEQCACANRLTQVLNKYEEDFRLDSKGNAWIQSQKHNVIKIMYKYGPHRQEEIRGKLAGLLSEEMYIHQYQEKN